MRVLGESTDMSTPTTEPTRATRPGRLSGVGRVLVAVYGVLALAATAVVLADHERFDEAPLAVLAVGGVRSRLHRRTVALVRPGRTWYRIAWATIAFEFAGVIVIGLLSLVRPDLFPHDTVWSGFGRGYLFVPLVLPVLGMWWLARHRPDPAGESEGAE